MFTGLIEEVGTLLALRGDSMRIRAPLLAPTLSLGDSVAVNGICLTATDLAPDQFSADVSASTRAVTTANRWSPGTPLNLERALAMGDRLGGHLVSGHVDAVGSLVSRARLQAAWKLSFSLSAEYASLMVPKGSVAIDGVSLTVNEVEPDRFSVTIIPHTGAKTHLLELRAGDSVNLEFDLLAKYVQRQLEARLAPLSGGLTMDKLAEHGFLT